MRTPEGCFWPRSFLDEHGEIGENLSVVGNLVVQNPCCRRAFLRGAFLAAGSISDPEKFYHFEIACTAQPKARQLQDIMASFDVDARIVQRKNISWFMSRRAARL